MKFSEYVVISRPVSIMDPLGFLGPFTALQDRLFRQFTVLSNHPAYHGVLALIYQLLASKGLTPKDKQFAHAFRQREVFWGLANVVFGSPVLNVTKYRTIADQADSFSVQKIRKGHAVYARLAYGTLGHYTSPSVFWNLLTKSGQQLTGLGEELAQAFASRGGLSLKTVLQRWADGQAISRDETESYGQRFGLAGQPDDAERAVWRKIIAQYCEHRPHVAPLWNNPLSQEEIAAFNRDHVHYRAFFPSLRQRYPTLEHELNLMEEFERMSGLIQFIFEREYLFCQTRTDFPTCPGALEEQLSGELGRIAARFVSSAPEVDTKGLFASLAGLSAYDEVAAAIVGYHVRHQKSKGASPFLEEGRLLIRDRVRPADFFSSRAELDAATDKESRCMMVQYRARRDWHFGRASHFASYARS